MHQGRNVIQKDLKDGKRVEHAFEKDEEILKKAI